MEQFFMLNVACFDEKRMLSFIKYKTSSQVSKRHRRFDK